MHGSARWPFLAFCCAVALLGAGPSQTPAVAAKDPQAPGLFQVRLETSRGLLVLELHRDWAPLGVDRFHELVRTGYLDGARFFRVVAGRWAQFGISGDPALAQAWRTRSIPDDPRKASNVRGTLAFAFAVPNGRTTQVFINLRDNSQVHDAQGFAPIGQVVEGMDVADALYSGYGETSGGGIRAGQQAPLFQGGNAYLERAFPKLDWIKRATLLGHEGLFTK
jgi:cyclophilin family peptidyl-prolyl cis-trans isomerase